MTPASTLARDGTSAWSWRGLRSAVSERGRLLDWLVMGASGLGLWLGTRAPASP